MKRFFSYYMLSHKREDKKDYKFILSRQDPLKIILYKIRLERRLKS